MKKRYYLSMLSIFLIIVAFDIVYCFIHLSLVSLIVSISIHFVMFGLINFAGARLIYKPIDHAFTHKENIEEGKKRIAHLAWYSSAWIFIIGAVYVALTFAFLFLFPGKIEGFYPDKIPMIYLFSSMIPSLLFMYAVFPAFITYFIINDFNFDLKTKAFIELKIVYPVGKMRIGMTLLFVLSILVFVPTLFIIMDLVFLSDLKGQYTQFTEFNPIGILLIDRLVILVGMIVAVVFVTRSFTKPIYSLLNEINKVRGEDYSSRAAIIAEDEIGMLTSKFNEMVQALEISHNKQKEYSHTLEKNLEQLNREIEEREKAEELARQQQESLIQADKMASVGILVSGVAHEINNPNNYMLLNSNNLKDVWNELKPVLNNYAQQINR